ncbi:hypothetical protein [Novosphingobium sp. 9]|uniref:hypothetical protein n=1 Tax=Novosphingobium sp. 9 TaxID=2025349 RepID=UPI0021B68E31|nr:hypothetical protein [Novosphingobium sp. 9]
MNDNRLVALMVLLILVPGFVIAWNDWRNGRVRLLLFSRMRSGIRADRETDPRKFRLYTAANVALIVLVTVGCVALFFKPV